ncbi:unnamed protein product [Prunus brigantina]
MSMNGGIRTCAKLVRASEASLSKSGTRGFHSTGVKRMGGHGHDEPYYLHAKHMYNLDRMSHQKLKVTLGVFTVFSIGSHFCWVLCLYVFLIQSEKVVISSSEQTLAHRSAASRRDSRISPWIQQLDEPVEAYSKGFTGSLCAVTPSTSHSSSPALSSVSGPWIMEFISCGSTTMLGNDTKTFQFWGKGHRKNELSTLLFHYFIVFILLKSWSMQSCPR